MRRQSPGVGGLDTLFNGLHLPGIQVEILLDGIGCETRTAAVG